MNIFRTGLSFLNKTNLRCAQLLPDMQTREYAARKGTREKARKKKVKQEVKKIGFIPHNLREKSLTKGTRVSRRFDDSFKRLPTDDVYVAKFHPWKVYDLSEAIDAHKETHHPQIYNCMESPLRAFVELNLKAVKKNKYIEPFNRIAQIPHLFDHGEKRSILVFCKSPEVKEEAQNAGATLIYDGDQIKKIHKGDMMLPDFEFILAHPNILAELVCLRGVLKKKFPNPNNGTLRPDIGDAVRTFQTGIHYYCLRDESELDFGWIDAAIGTVNMKNEELEANFKSLLDDINSKRPKREGSFITRALLKCEPSVEKFKINLTPFLGEELTYESDSDEEDEKASGKN